MKMCSYVAQEFCSKEVKLMRLEALVNPLLDENELVRLGFLLQKAVDARRGVKHSAPFHRPVEKRRYPVSSRNNPFINGRVGHEIHQTSWDKASLVWAACGGASVRTC